jgi:predicted protein tyrosine phosphatase
MYPMSDFGTTNLASKSFLELLDRLHTMQDGNVLVHCRQGMNRSPTLVVAYLVRHGKMTLRDALQCVTTAHPLARPHPEYMRQLCDCEIAWTGASSITFQEISAMYPSLQDIMRSIREDNNLLQNE